jgi:hypothetical protein
MGNHDYDAAINALDQISSHAMLSSNAMQSQRAKINELRNDAVRHYDRQRTLRSEIDDAVGGKNLDGLLEKVDECLAISPADPALTTLRERLAVREEKLVPRIPSFIVEAKTNAQAGCFEDAMVCLDRIPASLQTDDSKLLRKTFEKLGSMREQAMTHLADAIQSGDQSVCELLLTKCEAYRKSLEKGAMQDQQFETRLIECRERFRRKLAKEQAKYQFDKRMAYAWKVIKWIALIGSFFVPLAMPVTGVVIQISLLMFVGFSIAVSLENGEGKHSDWWVGGCVAFFLLGITDLLVVVIAWPNRGATYNPFDNELFLYFYFVEVAVGIICWFVACVIGPVKK